MQFTPHSKASCTIFVVGGWDVRGWDENDIPLFSAEFCRRTSLLDIRVDPLSDTKRSRPGSASLSTRRVRFSAGMGAAKNININIQTLCKIVRNVQARKNN